MNASLQTNPPCDSRSRTPATLLPLNGGKNYRQLLSRTCEKILNQAKPLSEPGGHESYKNLISLKDGQPVGQWRDSNHGLGGGRYPYDVNTALMPAALRAIAELARAGVFEDWLEWDDTASRRAEVWERSTLEFFTVRLRSESLQRVPKLTQETLTAHSL